MPLDAIVIGAGHNGLVAASYLAGAGLRTLVLERRDIVGGAAVTEEIVQGFRVSAASYSLSLLRPDIHRDLELERHGLVILPKDPQTFVPLPDGDHFFIWRDEARTVEELRRLHPGDADAYPPWNAFWEEAARVLRPLVEDPDPPLLREVEKLIDPEIWRLAVAGSAAEAVSEFFDHPALRGTLACQGLIGTMAGPHDPGTAWVMAYHALGGEICGATGTWAYVKGGMGSVTAALARAAAERGVEIRTGAEVAEVLLESGRVRGVALASGETIEAPTVLSNASPEATFRRLVPAGALDRDFIARIDSWRYDGCVVKVNLALDQLPEFIALGGRGPQHEGTLSISPSLEYLEAAFQDARLGRVSRSPFMEVYIQSAVDPEMAPEGKHVLGAFAQYAPAVGMADWEAMREPAGDVVIDTLAGYAPNVRSAVVVKEVLGPPDLEARFGLTGGDIFHGSILPEQSFGNRFGYRTPIVGLYVCGSGARPGGTVMGAAGRNAARAALSDLRRGGQRDMGPA